MSPAIVCIGGGHGLAAALRATRQITDDVTAVVTVADDGGSSGILREELGIPAPGDLRMAIAALAGDAEREGLVQYRFREGELAGHPLGNLIIAALADLRGDFGLAVAEVATLAGVRGRVMPVSTGDVHLAGVVGGVEIRGQVALARGDSRVERLWLEPHSPPANPEAIEAIESADLVVLGPGSLFTSVIATLLTLGVREAVGRAGRVALVLNITEQAGETLGMDAAAHVSALTDHCPGLRIDAILAHDGDTEGLVRPIAANPAGIRPPMIAADLRGRGAVHDPDKLAAVLKGLLR